MPPKAKDAKKVQYRQGTQLKDIVPPTIKQPPREGKPTRIVEYVPAIGVINPYQPSSGLEEWPGDEAALNFDFGLESQTAKNFVDPVNFAVPPSFKAKENQLIFWRRPKELIKEERTEGPMSLTNLGELKMERNKTTVDGQAGPRRLSILDDDEGTGGALDTGDMEIILFRTFDRVETPEEAERRVKEQTEKQQQQAQKKKPAKNEVIDTNPQKVKDVKLSNMNMKDQIPAYAKWIASQLQAIKDQKIHDVNTKKPIWSKIYPQKDGVPVINPTGRYWVKLYWMGKEKKIEIDDRVPIAYGKSLFPRSVKPNEIWPYILTKALIKLNSSRWAAPGSVEQEVGDGSIIYALTGYIPETINVSTSLREKWRGIVSALSDEKYNSGEKYVTCFCLPDHKPSAPSNRLRSAKEMSDSKVSSQAKISTKRDSLRSQSEVKGNGTKASMDNLDPKSPQQVKKTLSVSKSPRQESIVLKKEEPGREKPTHVIPGFAYSVVDLFENENFNMVYAMKRTENEYKLRAESYNLSKVSTTKMTKDEKLEHRRVRKELKDKIMEEDNKRMELIKKPAIHYKLLKVKSSVKKVSALDFVCPFDQIDITLARKCIMNKLAKPPNYDSYEFKADDKSVSSTQVETQKLLPLDDFSRIENAKEPLKRAPGGSWLTHKDFEGCFQYIQVFHDPTRFKYKENFRLAAKQEEEFVNYDDKEVIVMEGNQEEEKEKDSFYPQYSFFYSFACGRAQNLPLELKPNFILQKYDFQHFEVAQSFKTLNQAHDSDLLILDNKNQVFRVQLNTPLSCYLWVASNLHFKFMSFQEFLCLYQGYQTKTQTIEYPVIEKNRYHLFYKGIINPLSQKETILYKLRNQADPVMLRSIRIKLIELTNKTYKSEEDFKTGVVSFPLEKAYYTTKLVPIQLEAGKKYMIEVEGKMAETTNEGTMDFDLVYKSSELALETVEQVEPLEYMDKYVPYKYGVLFSERLFVRIMLNNEAQASFFVRITDVIGGASAQQAAQKGGKKGEVVQFEEREITHQRTIKLELLRDNELVAYSFGQNQVILSNVGLYPTNNKDEPRNYILRATFDLREWPEAKEENEHTCNLHWILKVHSTDTVAVIKDTQKEDNVKAIKKSWEDKEPGRADKAKQARKKFLIIEKIKKGEHVEPDELQLVNEPRQKKNKEEEAAKKDPKAKQQPKGAPAKAPPGKGGAKKEEAPVEEKKEQRPLPKSDDHVMSDICKFLVHMEQPRLLEEAADDEEGPIVRSNEEQRELTEKILLGREEVYGMYERNRRARDNIKQILVQKKERILKEYQEARLSTKEKLVALMKEREEFRKKDKDVKDKDRAIIALCKQEKPNYEEVVKCITENTGSIDPDLLKILDKVKKNAYIGEKIDRVTNALANYDIPALTAVIDEIRNEELEIDAELYEKAEEMLDMAEKNPTFIADKQKEAQKAQKGKKK